MTDQQINEIIGQQIGWRYANIQHHANGWHQVNGLHHVNDWHHEDGRRGLPDFCNDYRAMLEAENWLIKVDELSWDDYFCSFDKGISSSTTRERAEKFISVLGR